MQLSQDFPRLANSDKIGDQETALLFMAACKSNRSEAVETGILHLVAAAKSWGLTPLAYLVWAYTPDETAHIADHHLSHLRCKNQIARTLRELASVYTGRDDLRGQITAEEVRTVWGIGPKLSSWIGNVFGREDGVVLDTHVLRFLRLMGVEDVPDQTPQDPATYDRLARAYQIIRAETMPNTNPVAYDLLIWNGMRETPEDLIAMFQAYYG